MIEVVRHGDRGAAVADLQSRLVRVAAGAGGAPLLAVDGEFGSATLEAVRRFQRERGLAADGFAGPETWRALDEAGHRLGDRLLWRSQTMMRGDDIRELQQRLNQLGFDAGPEDGIFGDLAHGTVEEFQRNVGLVVDGVAGPTTLVALRLLHRDHHRAGNIARAREREWLRRQVRRGLAGTRLLIDPSHGPLQPGHVAQDGTTEAEITWQIATRLAARLAAGGADVLLSRGLHADPPPGDRARFANEQGVDLVLSLGLGAHDNPAASGCATFYYGTPQFVSEAGWRLAEHVQGALVDAGWQPDCRAHPMTWSLLRETKAPTVVVEPGFLSSPADAARLCDAGTQDLLAGQLATAVSRFLDVRHARAV